MLYTPYIRFVLNPTWIFNRSMLLKCTYLATSSVFNLFWFLICQFQPVLVKKDQQQTQNEIGKLGRSDNNPDPVVAGKSSSSVSGPQASA
jgi:hypothetical protein